MSRVTCGRIKPGLGEDNTIKNEGNLEVQGDLEVTGTYKRNIVMTRINSYESTNSTSPVDIPGMTLSITVSENGRILVSGSVLMSNTSGTSRAFIRLIRVGADANLFVANSATGLQQNVTLGMRPADSNHNAMQGSFQFLDSPGEGTHIYKLQFWANSGNVVVGGNGSTSNADHVYRSPTVLIAEEV